ncbi:MAG: hypothetical protein MR695_00985 [Solobacterium sp.]|nr:hypothetical protein [Solobacterium sp.]
MLYSGQGGALYRTPWRLNCGIFILGSPIWAGNVASIVNSFLYRYDVKYKIVGLFVTSGSGHGERCIKKISKKLKNLRYSVSLIGGAKHSKELEDFVNKLI